MGREDEVAMQLYPIEVSMVKRRHHTSCGNVPQIMRYGRVVHYSVGNHDVESLFCVAKIVIGDDSYK